MENDVEIYRRRRREEMAREKYGYTFFSQACSARKRIIDELIELELQNSAAG